MNRAAKRGSKKMITYKRSGVDIDAADRLVKHIKKKAPAIGGFSGLFPLDPKATKGQCLVASTDGVGTKLKVAQIADRHDTIGIDLVAMCVNDLVTCGAKPLFFLDYLATGKLDVERSKKVMNGIFEGCRQAGAALLGGETAEMPGFYPNGEYDVAGFSVGIVDKKEVIDGSKIFPGDLIIGLPSTGPHSNGYSLIRKVFQPREIKRRKETLLEPTRIYVDDVRRLIDGLKAKDQIVLGMAHITGGGIVDNVPRILPKRCRAVIDRGAWEVPQVFSDIQKKGNVPEAEMWRTFNMGIGLVVVIRPDALETAKDILPEARLIGQVVSGKPSVTFS